MPGYGRGGLEPSGVSDVYRERPYGVIKWFGLKGT